MPAWGLKQSSIDGVMDSTLSWKGFCSMLTRSHHIISADLWATHLGCQSLYCIKKVFYTGNLDLYGQQQYTASLRHSNHYKLVSRGLNMPRNHSTSHSLLHQHHKPGLWTQGSIGDCWCYFFWWTWANVSLRYPNGDSNVWSNVSTCVHFTSCLLRQWLVSESNHICTLCEPDSHLPLSQMLMSRNWSPKPISQWSENLQNTWHNGTVFHQYQVLGKINILDSIMQGWKQLSGANTNFCWECCA